MAGFSELVKNFDKIRSYMRSFYIYGFKTRNEFNMKSLRTYDNEKRRCYSYLGDYMRWTHTGKNKVSFVSVDCSRAKVNPLYAAWKSKSFTSNDILLHFYLLTVLGGAALTADALTDKLCALSGVLCDLQTVRNKCNEYAESGILTKEKRGKAYYYGLSRSPLLPDGLIDAVKFFQGGTLGVVGSYILDGAEQANNLFVFKHHYIANTLDDGILLSLLKAIKGGRKVRLNRTGGKTGSILVNNVCPVRILTSVKSGRRYICVYVPWQKRFTSYRLDSILNVEILDEAHGFSEICSDLDKNINKAWGVSFDGGRRDEPFEMTLRVDECTEGHILNRLKREGRGGTVERIAPDTFLFKKDCFDANEALPWVKTFIGRIISYRSTPELEAKLKGDLLRLAEIYGIDSGVMSGCADGGDGEGVNR